MTFRTYRPIYNPALDGLDYHAKRSFIAWYKPTLESHIESWLSSGPPRITGTQNLFPFGVWLLRLAARLAASRDPKEIGFEALDECRFAEEPASAFAGRPRPIG